MADPLITKKITDVQLFAQNRGNILQVQDSQLGQTPIDTMKEEIKTDVVAQLLSEGGVSLDIVNIKGVVATYADLTLITDAQVNDAYQVEADGLAYVWDGSEWVGGIKVQPNVNGVVEQGNNNAVSGNEVYETYNDVVKIKGDLMNFNLLAGSIDTTTGVPNTSINWLYAIFENIEGNTQYKLQGYSIDANSANRRVFYFTNNTLISYVPSTGAEFIFTTPSNCNKILVQVASVTNVGADIPNSPYWDSLKMFKGTNYNSETTIVAEKIKGTINTDQLNNIEKTIQIDNNEFLNKFSFTQNVGDVSYKTISMLNTTSVNHLNFASTNENNISKLSVKITSIPTNGTIRLGFGYDKGGYLVVMSKTGTNAEIYEMSNYGVNLLTSINYSSMTINVNDIITLRRCGSLISLYINNVLKGSRSLILNGYNSLYTQALIGFRDFSTKYEASEINTNKRNSPYMHISIDDTISMLRELTESNYTSIFENPRLSFYKLMHDKYGSCFSFYLFYQNSANTYNISQMPTKYKAEFIANSSWLKFGFHGIDAVIDYNTISTSDMVLQYNQIINQIIRFSSVANLDVIPRFSMFAGNTVNLIELKKHGILGLLTADDNRVLSAGLNETERNIVQNSDDYFNYENKLYYIRSEYRLDLATNETVINQLNSLKNNIDNNNVYEMFFHEGKESNQEGKDMIEAMCKWSYDNRIRFDFPQNNIFK